MKFGMVGHAEENTIYTHPPLFFLLMSKHPLAYGFLITTFVAFPLLAFSGLAASPAHPVSVVAPPWPRVADCPLPTGPNASWEATPTTTTTTTTHRSSPRTTSGPPPTKSTTTGMPLSANGLHAPPPPTATAAESRTEAGTGSLGTSITGATSAVYLWRSTIRRITVLRRRRRRRGSSTSTTEGTTVWRRRRRRAATTTWRRRRR